MGMVAIPAHQLGTTLDETDVKNYLQECNPELHFDMGNKLGIWHPYMAFRQGVFLRGRHICSMDRQFLPEVPIWTVRQRWVRVPSQFLSWGEIADPFTIWETVTDKDGKTTRTGYASVKRKEKHKIVRVGWRHTFGRILSKNIPGVTKPGLEERFGINLDFKLIEDPPEVIEDAATRILEPTLEVGHGGSGI